MKDQIIKGTGNSRYLKSSLASGTTWDAALAMLRNGTFPIDLNGTNTEGITQAGTALSKKTLLQDSTASLIGLGGMDDPTVDDAFLALKGVYLLKLQVMVNNAPAKAGIVITSGMTALDGSSTVETDEDGIATGIISTSASTITTRDYIDLPSKSLSVPAPTAIVTNATIDLGTPSSGEKEYTSSQSALYFSPYAADFDICVVGGGAGAITPASGWPGCGGGGGYVSNLKGFSTNTENKLSIVVGSGGVGANGGNSYVSVNNVAIITARGGYRATDSGAAGSGNGNGGIWSGNGGNGEGTKYGDDDGILIGGGGGGSGYAGTAYIGTMKGGSPYGGDGGTTNGATGSSGRGPGGGGGGGGYRKDGQSYSGENGKGYRGTCWFRWRISA